MVARTPASRARSFAASGVTALAAGFGAVLLAAAPASAHTGHGVHGWRDGFLHPITGPDHLLAMVAVGIVAVTTLRDRSPWLAPAAFLGGMAVGGVAGIGGVPMPGAEHIILASVLVLGLVIAGAAEGAGTWLLAGLVVAGIAHGHAHGAEAPAAAQPIAYVAAFLVASAALHLTGVAVGKVVADRRTIRLGMGAATVAAAALLVA